MADKILVSSSSSTSTCVGHPVALEVMVGFLRTGRLLDHASSVVMLGIFILMQHQLSSLAVGCSVLALLLSVIEKYYAWRVALDAEFFMILAVHPNQVATFDTSLSTFLGHSRQTEPRNMV
jgi:hypothetical protein